MKVLTVCCFLFLLLPSIQPVSANGFGMSHIDNFNQSKDQAGFSSDYLSDVTILSHPVRRVFIHWSLNKGVELNQIIVLRRPVFGQRNFEVVATLNGNDTTCLIENHPSGEFQYIVKPVDSTSEEKHQLHRVYVGH